MSAYSSEAQTRIALEDGEPIVVDAEVALSEISSVLKHERRRCVLSVLTQEPTPIDVHTLAREVIAQEESDTPETVSGEAIWRTKIALHHRHLPQIADVGLIAYDADEGTVEEIDDAVKPVTG